MADFREVKPGTRVLYSYTDPGPKQEYGIVIKSDQYGFTVKFDRIWYHELQTGESGLKDSWTFSSISHVTFLYHGFNVNDIVRITQGEHLNKIGLLYNYEKEVCMVDVDHQAIPCLASELELVSRKQLI